MVVRFEWDPTKAETNLRKHRVSFESAARIFADPFILVEHDRIEGGEHRWQAFGSVEGQVVLMVAHTIREEGDGAEFVEIVRIISARKAEPKERRRYENESR